MKLGEKLQQLRKQSGLSQEQLASQLTVSRQAVSKWELDESMPDTENVIQLSRIFGVSCDYLLREEVAEPNAQEPPRPTPPGETHLDESGWVRNAFTLSLFTCAIGLLIAFGGWVQWQTIGPIIIGLVVQISGVMLFELAVPRMGSRREAARLRFYKVANWLLVPIPFAAAWWWAFSYATQPFPALLAWSIFLSCDLSLCGICTGILSLRLWRQTRKK